MGLSPIFAPHCASFGAIFAFFPKFLWRFRFFFLFLQRRLVFPPFAKRLNLSAELVPRKRSIEKHYNRGVASHRGADFFIGYNG